MSAHTLYTQFILLEDILCNVFQIILQEDILHSLIYPPEDISFIIIHPPGGGGYFGLS